jgi:hypothetical protein
LYGRRAQHIGNSTTRCRRRARSARNRRNQQSDFSNGIWSVLDFRVWTFINSDLTVSLTGNAIGEWILFGAEARLAANGDDFAFAKPADTSLRSAAFER